MTVASCPTRDDLEAFARGELPDDEIELVGDHVDVCDECESTVALLEQQSDTFVDKFRGPSAEAGVVDEPVFHDAVERIKAIGREPTHPLDSSIATDDAPPASRLREYRLLARLGAGGMGTVYKAVHTKLRRVVALKVLPVQHRRNAASISRFQREIEAVGKLDHPNVVRAFDAGEDGDMHYLVMELVEGVDLHTLMKQHGPLPVADACEIIRQAALGLQHAHEHGLVHRDLKPSNLMLSSGVRSRESGVSSSNPGTTELTPDPCSLTSVIKILDLGLALLQGEPKQDREELTATGQVMGTLDYMAPEQADDSHGVDIRSDIYALGCTLYKLLTGHAPFSGESYNSIAKKLRGHAENAPPPVRETRPEVPGTLSELIGRMLAKSPEDRPSTPADVATALEPFCDSCDLPALADQIDVPPQHDLNPASQAEIAMMLPMSKRSKKDRGRRRLGIFTGVASLLLLLAAAGAVVIAIRSGDGPKTTVEVPEGSRVKIGEHGQVAVTLPDGQPADPKQDIGHHPVRGERVNGLMTTLAVHSTTWHVGDEIELTYIYKNVSNEPIRVPAWWAKWFSRFAFEPLTPTDAEGVAVGRDMRQFRGDPFGQKPWTNGTFVTLPAGGSKTFKIRGQYDDKQRLNIEGPFGDIMWYRLPAGQYHVRALLDATRYPTGMLELDPTGSTVPPWKGKVLSGPVEVTVSGIVGSSSDTVKPASGAQTPASVGPFLLPDPIVLDAYNTELPSEHRWFASGPNGLIWTEQGPVLASQRELGVGPVEVWYEDGESWRRIGRTPYPAPNARFVSLSDDVGVFSNLSFGGRKISEAFMRISGAGRFHELPGDGLPKHILTGPGRTELPFSAGIEDIHWIWPYALVTDGDRALRLLQVQGKPQTDELTWPLFFCSNLCRRGSGDERPGLGQGIISQAADGVAIPHFQERPPLLQLAPDHLVSFARDEKGRPLVLRTTDGGKTWSQTLIELRDPIYPEDANRKVSLAAVRLHDGSLALVFRTSIPKPDPPPGSGFVPTHTARYFLTISADEGRTWQPGIPIGEEQDDTRGTEPVRIAAAGRTIVVSHAVAVRFPGLNTISVAISTDTGKTWQRIPLEGRFDRNLQLNELAVSPDGTRVLIAANVYDPEDKRQRHQLVVQEIRVRDETEEPRDSVQPQRATAEKPHAASETPDRSRPQIDPQSKFGVPPPGSKLDVGDAGIVPLQLPPGEPLIDPDLEAKLDRNVDLDFAQTPLAAALEEIGKRHNIGFDIDEAALKQAGLTPNLPIKLQLSGVRLREALYLMLTPQRLTWRLVEEGSPTDWSVKITTWDTGFTLTVLFYPLGNLSAWRSQFDGASLGPSSSKGEWNCLRKRSVEGLLMSLVYPTTWDEAGGSGSVERFGNRLVVSHIIEAHQEIRQMFHALRALFGPDGPRRIDAKPADRDDDTRRFIAVRMSDPTGEIRRALNQKVSVTADNEPLDELCARLSKRFAIPIDLSRRTLIEANIPADSPITSSTTGESLRSALERMLRDVKLVATVGEGRVVITTPENVENCLSFGVCSVRSLMNACFDEPPTHAEKSFSGDGAEQRLDELVEGITFCVARFSWKDVGGPGRIAVFGDALVIRQTDEVFDQIEEFLDTVRRIPSPSDVRTGKVPPVSIVFEGPSLERRVHRFYPVADLLANESVSAEDLVELIESTVHPTGWATSGGDNHLEFFTSKAALAGDCPPDVHQEIEQLLARVRRTQPAARVKNATDQ